MRWLSQREIGYRYQHGQLEPDCGVLPTSETAGQIYTRYHSRAWYETGLKTDFLVGVSCP